MTDSSLREVAATADQVAADQRTVAARARYMEWQRERGWSWSRILEQQPSPGIVALLRQSRQHLSAATAALTTALAVALKSEGRTRRQIAGHLGITHQRVTTLLRGAGEAGSSPDSGRSGNPDGD